MFLTAQYAWFEPVLIATIVVFIIDYYLIGKVKLRRILTKNPAAPAVRRGAEEDWSKRSGWSTVVLNLVVSLDALMGWT